MAYNTISKVAAADVATANEKRLSICLKPNGFSFALASSDKLLAVAEVEGNGGGQLTEESSAIKHYFESIDIRPLELAEAELIVTAESFVWIPDEVYDHADEHRYLTLSGAGNIVSQVYSDHNDMLHSWLVFSARDNRVTAFKIAFPGIKIRCQHSKLASPTLANITTDGMSAINLRSNAADMAAYSAGRYLFGRTFSCANSEELIFQTLEVVKMLGLESDSFRLMLCGDVDRDIYAAIRPYFASVALYTGRQLQFATDEFHTLHTYRHALILS